MRETGFIDQNKKKWVDFENHLKQPKKDPDKLSSQFVQITDDLSYSRTFYPNRSVRVYLNNIAQKVFHSIYRNKTGRWSRFRDFWAEDLPHMMYDAKKEMLISLLVFVVSMAIGVLSSIYNPDFPRQILGDSYISMTEENIKNGDPMAVYKSHSEFDMLLGITINNLMVAALTFVMGALFSIGTIGVMVYNGIMVGCFQYFFYEKGLFVESFLTIWLHGTLEISCIIIAGGAGLTMGRGLVFPGTFTRGQAFRLSAQRGIKIMFGIGPIICFAAIIESFITRYTDVPDWVKAMLIFISAAFIITYFVIIPILRARRGFRKPLTEHRLPPSPSEIVRIDQLKDNGELFKDTFIFYRKVAGKLAFWALLLAAAYGAFFSYFYSDKAFFSFTLHPFGPWGMVENIFSYLSDIQQYFTYREFGKLPLINLFLFSGVCFFTFFHLRKHILEKDLKMSWKYFLNYFWRPFIPGIVITGIFFMDIVGAAWIMVLFMPVFLCWTSIMHLDRVNPVVAFARAWAYAIGLFNRAYGLYLVLVTVTFLSIAVLSAPQIVWFLYEVICWFVDFKDEAYLFFFVGFFTFLAIFALMMIMPVYLAAAGIQFFTFKEIREAPALTKQVENIGMNRPKRMMFSLLIPLVCMLGMNQARAQEGVIIQDAVEAVQEDSIYDYEEGYYNDDYETLQEEKKKRTRQYYNSKIEERKISDQDWKNAKEGLEYSEDPREKPRERDLDIKIPSGGGMLAGGLGKILLFCIAGAVIALVLILLIRSNMLKKNTGIRKKVFSIEEAEEDIHQSDLDHLLRISLEKKDYKTALRVYYLMVIRDLSEMQWISWKRDKTNREYLNEMRERNSFQSFRNITQAFEMVWYGDANVAESDFKMLGPRFTGFLEELKKSKTV